VVTTERMSRSPDERLYSGSNDSFAFTQCYVSFGDPDGEDFAFTKCNPDGSFTLSGLPDGDWRVTVFDQWNDMLVDGLSTPVRLAGGAAINMGEIATNQWQANIYTKSFIDLNGDGVAQDNEPGLTLVPIEHPLPRRQLFQLQQYRSAGNAGFSEVFPLFSWYVVGRTTRFKNTGTHVVYDSGGPADGSSACLGGGTAPCGNSSIATLMANTAEQVGVPAASRAGRGVLRHGGLTGVSIATGRSRRLQRPRRLDWPHRPALGSHRGLAGFLRTELVPRVRQEALRCRRKRRHPRRGDLRLHPSVRRPGAADPHQLDPGRARRDHQPLPGGHCRGRRHPDPEAGRHHQDHELGRVGAGLPL
jgi:hypothetical protein